MEDARPESTGCVLSLILMFFTMKNDGPVRVQADVLSEIAPIVSKAKIQTVSHGFQENLLGNRQPSFSYALRTCNSSRFALGFEYLNRF